MGTHKDNIDDKVSKRRHRYGIRHPMVKATDEQVAEMRRLHGEGVMQKVIAERFGMSKQQVSKIVRGLQRVKGD